MNTAIIGLGSNINPGKNIQDALNILNRHVVVVRRTGKQHLWG